MEHSWSSGLKWPNLKISNGSTMLYIGQFGLATLQRAAHLFGSILLLYICPLYEDSHSIAMYTIYPMFQQCLEPVFKYTEICCVSIKQQHFGSHIQEWTSNPIRQPPQPTCPLPTLGEEHLLICKTNNSLLMDFHVRIQILSILKNISKRCLAMAVSGNFIQWTLFTLTGFDTSSVNFESYSL